MSGDAGKHFEDFIAALDIGTTNVRCLIINSSGLIVGKAHEKVKLYQPHPGWEEINPDELYKSILEVINKSVQDANITFSRIKSLGISTQRATFITWTKDSGMHLHNFITWQDKRAEQLVKDLNSSWVFSCFRGLASLLYSISRIDKFKMASHYQISCVHVSSRLLWVLAYVSEVKENLKNNNLLFGTLDTWLLYKLTNGRLYVTDVSNASATGFFDLFNVSWGFIPSFLKIPSNILPHVVDNDYEFGETAKDIFSHSLKIGCVMGDQMASMFSSGCYGTNNLKITIGTGAFLNVNTGDKVHPSLKNMYPMIGWKINHTLNYILELPCVNSGYFINWLEQVGLLDEPSQSSKMALKAMSSKTIFFLPQMAQFHTKLETAFIGIDSSTTKEQMVKAVLESIVYQIVLHYQLLLSEMNQHYNMISIDGGIAKNDFICQFLADLTKLPVRRMVSTEMSGLGVAYVAALSSKMWSKHDIKSLQVLEKMFYPIEDKEYSNTIKNSLLMWKQVSKK